MRLPFRGDGIIPAGSKRPATEQAADRQRTAFPKTVYLQRLDAVGGAGGFKPAAVAQMGRYHDLIGAHHQDQASARPSAERVQAPAHGPALSGPVPCPAGGAIQMPAFRQTRSRSARTSRQVVPRMPPRAMRMTSASGGRHPRDSRNASRSSRFARLRSTASWRVRLETTTPALRPASALRFSHMTILFPQNERFAAKTAG